MKNIFWLALAFMFLMLTACSTKIPADSEISQNLGIKKEFKNKSSVLDSENPQNSENSQNSSQQKTAPIAQLKNIFDDPNLHNLLNIALERNKDVLIMASRISQAASTARISAAAMFPTINGNLSSNYTDNITQSQNSVRAGTNSTSINVSTNWEIDLFGKLNALRKANKKNFEVAQSNLENAQISLAAQVATLYYTILDNAQNLQNSRKIIQNLEQIAAFTQAKFELGLSDFKAYSTAFSNLATQQNNFENLSYTMEQNRNAMMILCNLQDSEFDEIFGEILQILAPDSENSEFESILKTAKSINAKNAPADVLFSRPDVRAQTLAYHAQLYKITNAKAARLPGLSISGSIGEVIASTNSANVGHLVFQIAGSISAPLFNRTSLKQQHKIQQELGKESFYTLQNTIATALGEIENALFDFDSKGRVFENLAKNFEVRAQNCEFDKKRFERKIIDLSDFLASQNDCLNASAQMRSALVSKRLAIINIYKAFGGDLQILD